MRSGLLVGLGIDQGCWESGKGGGEGHSAWRYLIFSIHFDKKCDIFFFGFLSKYEVFLYQFFFFNKTLAGEKKYLVAKAKQRGRRGLYSCYDSDT